MPSSVWAGTAERKPDEKIHFARDKEILLFLFVFVYFNCNFFATSLIIFNSHCDCCCSHSGFLRLLSCKVTPERRTTFLAMEANCRRRGPSQVYFKGPCSPGGHLGSKSNLGRWGGVDWNGSHYGRRGTEAHNAPSPQTPFLNDTTDNRTMATAVFGRLEMQFLVSVVCVCAFFYFYDLNVFF